MNNQQRGVYQPLMENIPIYDLSDDEPEEEEEERSRLPLLIVVALLVLAAFAGVVWVAYNQGVARGRAGTVIAAQAGPIRTAPTDAGGDTTPFTGLKVYTTPVPPDREAQSSTLAQVAAPRAAAPAAPTSEAPPIRLNPDAPALASPPRPAAPAQAAVPARPAAPPAQAVRPAQTASVPPPAQSALRPTAPPAPPAPASAAAPAQPGAPQRLTTPPPLPAQAAAPQRPAVPPAATASAASGAAVLQIGSFESQDLANGGWQAFRNRFPALAANLSQDIQRADLGARGIFYRLRVGPFADRNAAIAACDKLRSQGGSCLVAAP